MQDFTLHTHTVEFDGKNTSADMVAHASETGFRAIGVSNHFIVHPDIKNTKMYEYAVRGGYNGMYSSSFAEAIDKFAAHYAELDALAKDSDIKIYRGMEADFFTYPEWHDGFMRAVEILRPDYIIGSAHFVAAGGTLCNSHDVANAAPWLRDEMVAEYWRGVTRAASSGLFTWMAHLDLMKKVGLGIDAKWIPLETAALDAIATSHSAIEINTSFYERGDAPYPSARIVKMAVARNIPIVFSDDAHEVSKIGRFWSRGDTFARDCGVENFLTLQKILDFRDKTL